MAVSKGNLISATSVAAALAGLTADLANGTTFNEGLVKAAHDVAALGVIYLMLTVIIAHRYLSDILDDSTTTSSDTTIDSAKPPPNAANITEPLMKGSTQ